MEKYGLEVDIAGIRVEVHTGSFWRGIDMSGHIGKGSAERGILLGIMREEREVLYGIPEGARSEGDHDEGEKNDATTALVPERGIEEEKYRECREEKNRDLGTDGSESVRETFIGEELRCKHDEENDEEEGVSREVGMIFPRTQPESEESPSLSEEEKEPCEKAGADDGVEDGIGCVIVTEVLIADEIVFDKGESECFREGAPEITVVHFRREEGDILRAIGEMMWVLGKIVEHRTRGDTRGEDEGECVLPEPSEEVFVREYEKWKEEDENEWREAKGDVGMEPEAEEKSSENERSDFLRSESAEEKIERE